MALAAACDDKSLLTWNIAYNPGQPVPAEFGRPLQGYAHDGAALDVVFAADNATIYSAGADKAVKQWRLAAEVPTKTFPHPREVDAVAFDPKGTILATGCHDGNVRLFDLAKGTVLKDIKAHPPQPAFNEPPDSITEPFTIMLFGITSERVNAWLGGTSDAKTLIGMAASPGRVEGPARVISSPEELDQVLEGEILVAPVTAPSWAPVFCRIKATVTDIGGIMSHAAIVCREYGLPAVTATGSASTTIKNGQMLRVDGHSGEVTIMS